jgi:hypothetical protein
MGLQEPPETPKERSHESEDKSVRKPMFWLPPITESLLQVC